MTFVFSLSSSPLDVADRRRRLRFQKKKLSSPSMPAVCLHFIARDRISLSSLEFMIFYSALKISFLFFG